MLPTHVCKVLQMNAFAAASSENTAMRPFAKAFRHLFIYALAWRVTRLNNLPALAKRQAGLHWVPAHLFSKKHYFPYALRLKMFMFEATHTCV